MLEDRGKNAAKDVSEEGAMAGQNESEGSEDSGEGVRECAASTRRCAGAVGKECGGKKSEGEKSRSNAVAGVAKK